MKTKLLLLLLTISSVTMYAQTNPDIEADTMLCPGVGGTAYVTNPTFDSYQWYYKYANTPGEFVAIEGATESIFTYDFDTYFTSYLKVVATVGGESYESDSVLIDAHYWVDIFLHWQPTPGVTQDPETGIIYLEEGTVFSPSIHLPYDTLIQWYRNDQPIEGANNPTYDITTGGIYTVSAAPSFCPGTVSFSMELHVVIVYAQTNPVIEADTMLCPGVGGTAYVTNPTFDSYQWYYKYWFSPDEFVAIEGATESSFTYDFDTYFMSYLKVVATVDGESYESDSVKIDSHVWLDIFIQYQPTPGVTIDPETGIIYLEEGAVFSPSINNPPYDTLIQWYRNDQPIEGANNATYDITEGGIYTASAAPSLCPGSVSFSMELHVVVVYAQTNPVIEADTMLCPGAEGTAYVTNPTFDSYQWYYKYWFSPDEFVAIEGATESSFTYDFDTYFEAYLKVVATVGGESYESDTVLIEAIYWLDIFIHYQLTPGVTFDEETGIIYLEEGAVFSPSIHLPYDTLIQWYRNDQPIEGANNPTYDITEGGIYTVSAAPSFCPASVSFSMELKVVVVVGLPEIDLERANIYPNPANSVLNIDLPGNTTFNKYSILDLSGRVLMHDAITPGVTPVSTDNLAKGFYILKLQGVDSELTRQFIKQ